MITLQFSKPKSVSNRPAISRVLVRASVCGRFCERLLAGPPEALLELGLPQEDLDVMAGIKAGSLAEFAAQLKLKLALN